MANLRVGVEMVLPNVNVEWILKGKSHRMPSPTKSLHTRVEDEGETWRRIAGEPVQCSE